MITEQEKIKLISLGLDIECPHCGKSLIRGRIQSIMCSETGEQTHYVEQTYWTDEKVWCCSDGCSKTWPEDNWKKFFEVLDEDGKHFCYLNPRLIVSKGFGFKEVEDLKSLHHAKSKIFKAMKSMKDKQNLRALASIITEIEFSLQRVWGFEINADYHHFWEYPGCTCPPIDNRERLGTKYHIYSCDCLIHGS